MSIQLVKIRVPYLRVAIAAAGVVCICFVWFVAKWNFANAISSRTDQKDVAEIALSLAPDDPQTHFAVAVIFQNTFEVSDISRSLAEYELATALSPANYICWLELGHARERTGDSIGALAALKKALELAPNYADVQWSYGNALLRSGNSDAAFEQISKATAGKPSLANAAIVAAMTAFGGDAEKVRRSFGDSPAFGAAMASYFAGQDKTAEAAAAWRSIPEAERRTNFKETGSLLVSKFLSAKQFRLAVEVKNDLSDAQLSPGSMFDGGFETGVKMRDAGAFEWLIAPGAEPQIALSTAQKHSGNNSLILVFNTMQAADFRAISQTVAVEPRASYAFEAFARAELKAASTLRWEIVDAADGKVIGRTEAVAANGDWSRLSAQFIVPATSDGVIVRLVRSDCISAVCPIGGRVWFDDLSIRRQ